MRLIPQYHHIHLYHHVECKACHQHYYAGEMYVDMDNPNDSYCTLCVEKKPFLNREIDYRLVTLLGKVSS